MTAPIPETSKQFVRSLSVWEAIGIGFRLVEKTGTGKDEDKAELQHD